MTTQKGALAAALWMLFGLAFGQSQPVALVKTVAVRRTQIAPTLTAYGSVTFAQDNQTDISLPYPAQLNHLQVGAGQSVKRGDPLFTAVADPGAVLSYRQAQNAVTLAHGELQRTLALFTQRLATQSQLSAAEKTLADAEQALAAQQQLGANAVERTARAPFDGVVTRLAAAQGDRVSAGGVILQLGRAGTAAPARVTLGIDPSALATVHPGASVLLTSLVSPSGTATRSASGRVRGVHTVINPQTRLVDVQVDVPQSPGMLLIPGEPVEGVITVQGAEHWAVPRSAVLRDGQGDYVFQIDRGHAHRVPVQVRVDNGEQLGVDGALQPARTLVVQGNYELADGMPVREEVR
ncbi:MULTISPECIES: efflux RND transporter periplasmic adaptor subunit [Burkholderiaceae]|uniref:Hemolysin D n=1 Tax=Pandoraea apista TaxID=93218 RepID=A0A5E5P5Y7_9BURK|nr:MULTISPECIES: efflux RND transporter periplasmic adaptor subunit [Burkholderiaceae]MBR8052092.1 efflux RND transporter periplasmic adaptor subunit [Burkholderia vietnamiensis]VVG71897.1 hemolysin D [Pandoraea apista]HDR9283076.1 efflux RND transporter periplasmic adaptor subunit [Burkholderia vietnamiensis]